MSYSIIPSIKLKKMMRLSVGLLLILSLHSVQFLAEGIRWQQDKNLVAKELRESKDDGILYFFLNEKLDLHAKKYSDYSNSWTQRLFSILQFALQGEEVTSVIITGVEREYDCLDFSYKDPEDFLKSLGIRFANNFDRRLIERRRF
jgi:hypothetical protein